jgi:hypothetical protein
MSRKITAFFSSFHIANGAVHELVEYGLPRESISVVADSVNGAYGFTERPMHTGIVQTNYVPDEYQAGTRIGGGIGAAFGLVSGFLAGTGALAVPGLEPAAAAGLSALGVFILGTTFAGTLAGGLFGRLLGAMIGLGIPEEEAEQYAESVRQSGVLVAVKAEAYNANLIRDVFDRYRPSEVADKTVDEQKPGWRKIRTKLQPVYVEEWERAQRR